MSFRGEGRGRGGGGFRSAKQVPFELFPEIEGLDTAEFPPASVRQLVRWSWKQQKDSESSPYYYEDSSRRPQKQKQDIGRYSDRQLQRKDVKRPLWHFIKLDTDHMPAELADVKKHVKKVKWTTGSDSPRNGGDMNKLDYLEKLEQQGQGKEGTEKKENEEEEVTEEDQGEYSDEGDYEQAADFDDDEDDFNMADDNDDEACY